MIESKVVEDADGEEFASTQFNFGEILWRKHAE
jgi:hypothetical protein